MRYYKVVIGASPSGTAPATFSTMTPEGSWDPGALQVELDVPVAAYQTPGGAAQVVIWGVSIQQISQAASFAGASISIYGGMSKGLPLANPAQAGLLATGQITQAYGNWIGTEQYLVLIVNPTGTTVEAPATPVNLTFNWLKGTPLGPAIQQCLRTAYPGNLVSLGISSNLVFNQDEHHTASTLTEMSQYLNDLSKTVLGKQINGVDYAGVDIALVNSTFFVLDGTQGSAPGSSFSSPIQLDFKDLVGQPTWIEYQVIQVNCVMRHDISPLDYVKLPPSAVTTTTPGAPVLGVPRQGSVFSGVFQVSQVRHVGSLRDSNAAAWITTLNAYPATAPASA